MSSPVLIHSPLLAEQLMAYAADSRFCPEERAHFRELCRLLCEDAAYAEMLEERGRLQHDYSLPYSDVLKERTRELAEAAAVRALWSRLMLNRAPLEKLERPRNPN